MPATFKELYCAHYRIAEKEFARSLFFKSVYPASKPLTVILFRCYPRWFELDLIVLKEMGDSTTFDEFQDEAEKIGFRYRKAQDFSLIRRVFKVRLSSRRLLRLAVRLFQKHINNQLKQ